MGKEKIEVEFGTYAGSPIQWIVLEKTDQKALLLSKYCLLKKSYHEYEPVTWADCTLRKWLNHDFYHDVFTSDEKDIILTAELENANNPLYETEGGKDTEDKVFLLSINEANEYFASDEKRRTTFQNGIPMTLRLIRY